MGRLPCEEFDDFVMGIVADRIFTRPHLEGVVRDLHEAAGSWAREHERHLAEVDAAIRRLEGKNSKIFEIMEEFGRDTPNLGDLTRRLRANNKQLRKFEVELAALEAEQAPEITVTENDVEELREVLLEIIQTAENVQKVRGFLRTFIKKVVINANDVAIYYRLSALITPADRGAVHSGDRSGCIWRPELDLLRTISVTLPERFRKAA